MRVSTPPDGRHRSSLPGRASKRQKVSAVARVFRVGWHYELLNDEFVCRRRGPI
jgi:hypothetical protein